MKKYKSIVFLWLGTLLIFPGCDSGTQSTQIQDVAELEWQSDGSAIYGFQQNYIETQTSTIPALGYTLSRFNTDGSLAHAYPVFPQSRPDFSYSLYVSNDGSTAVTQLENDLYRYGLKSGVLEKLQTLFHLIVVSPDLHYAVGSPSPFIQPRKTIIIYDITASPIRIVKQFDVDNPAASSGVWLNNGNFAITIADSVGTHIDIFDTTSTGTPLAIIGGAETQFHNVVFHPQTNQLYVRNHAGKTNDYNVDRINLLTLARANILNFKVENFDVSQDEKVIVYSAYDSTNTISMKSRNLLSQQEMLVATDILRIISLSPANDKLAYIRGNVNHNEIHVIPFIKP
jgi:hypothetical protein